jgi:hypothetical protein
MFVAAINCCNILPNNDRKLPFLPPDIIKLVLDEMASMMMKDIMKNTKIKYYCGWSCDNLYDLLLNAGRSYAHTLGLAVFFETNFQSYYDEVFKPHIAIVKDMYCLIRIYDVDREHFKQQTRYFPIFKTDNYGIMFNYIAIREFISDKYIADCPCSCKKRTCFFRRRKCYFNYNNRNNWTTNNNGDIFNKHNTIIDTNGVVQSGEIKCVESNRILCLLDFAKYAPQKYIAVKESIILKAKNNAINDVIKKTVVARVETDKQKKIYQRDINKYDCLITQAEELIKVFKAAKSIAENLVDEMDTDLNGLDILMDLYKKIQPTVEIIPDTNDVDEIYNINYNNEIKKYKIASKKFVNVEDTAQYENVHKRAYDDYHKKCKNINGVADVSLGFYEYIFRRYHDQMSYCAIENLINLKELHITNDKITSLAGIGNLVNFK